MWCPWHWGAVCTPSEAVASSHSVFSRMPPCPVPLRSLAQERWWVWLHFHLSCNSKSWDKPLSLLMTSPLLDLGQASALHHGWAKHLSLTLCLSCPRQGLPVTMVHLLRKAVLEGIVSSFGVTISWKFQRTRGGCRSSQNRRGTGNHSSRRSSVWGRQDLGWDPWRDLSSRGDCMRRLVDWTPSSPGPAT